MADNDDLDGVSCTGNAICPSSSATAAEAAEVENENAAETKLVDVPIMAQGLTFDETVAAETQKLVEFEEAERRRQHRRWRQEVEMMRGEFVALGGRRSARRCRSQSPTPRDSSSAVVGERPSQHRLPPNYFRRFFDTSGFEPDSVCVSVERGTLVLGVTRAQQPRDNCADTTSMKSDRPRYFRFAIPPSVDLATIRAVLSADGILLVEADIGTGTLSSPDQSFGSNDSGPPVAPKREKIGKPVFREDEDGKRRMHLLVDIGDSFRPKDIYVQAMKSDRFEV